MVPLLLSVVVRQALLPCYFMVVRQGQGRGHSQGCAWAGCHVHGRIDGMRII